MRRPQDKTYIRGVNPGISYKLRNKDAIGGRGWNIATQERKICDVEIEIVTLVINSSVKLTVSPDRQKLIQVRSRSVALCRVFDLEFNGIHLAQVILKLWVVYGQNIIDVPVYVKLNRDANCFPPVESKECINSASYEKRNMSARRGDFHALEGI